MRGEAEATQSETVHAGQAALGCFAADAARNDGFFVVKARVTVMLKEGVLDPQGRAIGHALGNLGFSGVGEVRAGKVIELELAETDAHAARGQAEAMARRLLANQVIECFSVEILTP